MTGRTQTITRLELLLLLLGTEASGAPGTGIGGMTRLQKLLFLLWKEAGIQQVHEWFEFEAGKAGPCSRKLYDELELLENLQLIKGENRGEATEAEAAEIEELSFGHLMGGDVHPFQSVRSRSEAITADSFEERKFTLTPKGLERVRKLLDDSKNRPFIYGIRMVKSKFANYSLQDLLYYVYTKYDKEGWTSESEIRDGVLRRGALC
jgi:hypothetical protein